MFCMPFANPPPLGKAGAILVATKIPSHHCTMHFANPSRLDIVDASLMAATFNRCAMPDTDSSLFGIVDATLVAATFLFRTVPYTNSSFHNLILAPIVSAS